MIIFIILYILIGMAVGYRFYKRSLEEMMWEWRTMRNPAWNNEDEIVYEARLAGFIVGLLWPPAIIISFFMWSYDYKRKH